MAFGPQQGHVLDDDLTAHIQHLGQTASGNRFFRPGQDAQQFIPSFFSVLHCQWDSLFRYSLILRRFFMDRSRIGAEWVSAPLEM